MQLKCKSRANFFDCLFLFSVSVTFKILVKKNIKRAINILVNLEFSPVCVHAMKTDSSPAFDKITRKQKTSVANTCYDVYSAEKIRVDYDGAD